MKGWFSWRLFGFLSLIFFGGHASSQDVELKETENFGSNPGNLEMYSYAPAQLSDGNHPLVIVLHGCTQSAADVAVQTGWNKLADSLQFFVLYPQTHFGNNVSKCFRWFREEDTASDRGESYSIYQMIAYFREKHPVDSTRIYITGLSAGGAMAVAMLARYPDLFSAGAIIAGGPYGAAWNIRSAKKAMRGKVKYTQEEWADFVRSQNPDFNGSYPKISIFHGTSDKTVRPANAEQLMVQWTHLHGAQTSPSMVIERFEDNPRVELRQYTNVQNEIVVRWYVLHEVKHALSISIGDAINQGGKLGKHTVDTGFHITWQSAVDFGLTAPR